MIDVGGIQITKFFLLITMAVVSISAFSACAAQETEPLADYGPDSDEYAVYSDLINSRYIGEGVGLMVVVDQTNAESGDFSQLRGVDKELIEDYQAKNNMACRLDRLFNLRVSYELISEEEARDTIESDPEIGWDIFYSTYPDSQGMLSLSRAGFNRNRTQALVYACNHAGPNAIDGNYYLLVKDGAAWVVKKMFEAWI